MTKLKDAAAYLAELETRGRELWAEKFEEVGKTHDWRNYVEEDMRNAWPILTDRERGLIYDFAEPQADREEWD